MRLTSVAILTGTLAAAGCASPVEEAAPRRQQPTFTKDIAPILDRHCVGCHRPGQPVPFTLGSFADVHARANAIAAAVGARRMPPWLPEHGAPAFVGERRLSDEQITLIQAWVKAGGPEGDMADLSNPPTWTSDWELGTPDLVATPPKPYTLQPGGHDVYRNIVLRLNLPSTRFVRALEFRPGGAPVHHAVIRVDRTRTSRAYDGSDGQPGFDGMAAYEVQDPDGHFLGWAPGRGPIVAPDDMPWVLHAGSDLVIELHLMPGSAPAAVQPSVGIFYTDRAPTRTPVMVVMGSKAIDIPAGSRNYLIEDRYRLPVNVEVLSVYPHAHFLAREMHVQALLPSGATRQILRIKQWSFNWQQDYRFVTPLALPAGTTLLMKYTYDNSEENNAARHRTVRRVTWGPQSHDEMGNLGVQLLTRTPDDAALLTRSFAEHAIQIDVAGAEALVKTDPLSAAHATFLGTSYVRAGRFSDAVPQLERALRLDPRSATSENYLGGALLALGRLPEALQHFRKAVALSPEDAHLRFNHAKVLAGAGHSEEAAQEYRRALALDPDFAEAHQHLGALYFSANRVAEALVHLRRAAELADNSPSAHSDYGGALAEAGRWDEALVQLRRALQLDPTNEAARENLTRLERLTRR